MIIIKVIISKVIIIKVISIVVVWLYHPQLVFLVLPLPDNEFGKIIIRRTRYLN